MSYQSNLSWLFYKQYYRRDVVSSFFNDDRFSSWNESIESRKNQSKKDAVNLFFDKKNKQLLEQSKLKLNHQKLFLDIRKEERNTQLKTIYPGFITGIGIEHETGLQGECKLGFTFDYTTGMPYIPASSVKGSLRSVFLQSHNSNLSDDWRFEREAFLDWLIESVLQLDKNKLISKLNALYPNISNLNFYNVLEREIFNGEQPKEVDGKLVFKPISIYQRDIFHDAFIVKSPSTGFLELDYITPHFNEEAPIMSQFKNPIPIQFLKIPGNVVFQFQWDLKDGILTAKEKELLFMAILEQFGIGAKTNVGYGQFVPIN